PASARTAPSSLHHCRRRVHEREIDETGDERDLRKTEQRPSRGHRAVEGRELQDEASQPPGGDEPADRAREDGAVEERRGSGDREDPEGDVRNEDVAGVRPEHLPRERAEPRRLLTPPEETRDEETARGDRQLRDSGED